MGEPRQWRAILGSQTGKAPGKTAAIAGRCLGEATPVARLSGEGFLTLGSPTSRVGSRVGTGCRATNPPVGSDDGLRRPCRGAIRAGWARWGAAPAPTPQVGNLSNTTDCLLTSPAAIFATDLQTCCKCCGTRLSMCTLVRPEDSPIQMMCDQTRR